MVCFCIALRSEKTTLNWTEVLENFQNTIRSIFNQTDGNFRVFVACNRRPSMDVQYDDRLQFIEVDFPIPSKWVEYCRDRALKLMACTMKIKDSFELYQEPGGGGIYLPS